MGAVRLVIGRNRLIQLTPILLLLTLTSTLVLVAGQTSTPLVESVAINALTTSAAPAYFAITIPNPFPTDAQAININVTPIGDGDPDIYGGWTEFPSTNSYTYRRLNWGEDTLQVPAGDTQGHTTLYLAIIAPSRPSNFTIVYTIDTPIVLSNGQPQVAFVHRSGYAYFNFLAPNQDHSVSFSATGRTKIYVGITNPIIVSPAPSNYLWSATFAGQTVVIDKSDPLWTPGHAQLYIAVYGVVDSTFTITATVNGTSVTLSNGIGSSAVLNSNDNAYYEYTVTGSSCQLQFTLNVLYGDPDLYVSQTLDRPNPINCAVTPSPCNISADWGGDTLLYESAATGTYHIGVYGFQDSSFTILATSVCGEDSFNSTATALTDGIGQHGVLSAHSYRYYSFAVGDAANFTFTLTARSGDPDLYIRNDGTPPLRSSYQWSASHVGSDTITIPANDPRACRSNVGCIYYIYVYSYTASDFFITVSSPSEQIRLYEGQASVNTLVAGEIQYYYMNLYVSNSNRKPVIISVTDFGNGDPDLLVSNHTPQPDPNNPVTYEWSSQSWSDDAVVIFPTDANYLSGNCIYYVAVYAFTTTTYSIVFHMDSPTVLQSGVPQQGTVPSRAYNYYSFNVQPGYGQIQIALSVRSPGLSNLFVTNGNVYPTLDDWSTFQEYIPWYTGSQQLVTINEGDVGACIPTTVTPITCTWMIGIQGFYNSSYTISAVINNSTNPNSTYSTLLQNGVSSGGQVTYHNYQYFRFIVSSPGQNLNVVVTASSGDPDLYISDRVLPTIATANWSSIHTGGDTLNLMNVATGIYYIGVYGWSQQDSTFTVTATLTDPSGPITDQLIQLLDGEQQSGFVGANSYLYYVFNVGPSVNQLLFAVSTVSGDPDIYVRYDPGTTPTILPSRTDPSTYGWVSSAAGNDSVSIFSPSAGVYTVAVWGFATPSNFIIGAATGSVFQRLSDGIPRYGSVMGGAYSYFRVWVNTRTDVTITITPFSGDPDLYIGTGLSMTHPNATTNYWSSDAWGSDSYTIPHNAAHACRNCYYYIGVNGYMSSTFLITANFGNEQTIIESVPVSGNLVAGGTVLYAFDMSQISFGSIVIDLTPSVGQADIFISMHQEPDPSQPTSYDFYQAGTFSGTHFEQDVTALCTAPGATQPCIMHIGVHSDYYSPQYSLFVGWSHSDRNIPLQNGQTMTKLLQINQAEYYVITVPTTGMDLVVTLISFSGDADLYMSNDPILGVHPNPNNLTSYKWRSIGGLGSADTITRHSTTPGDYFIGVYGYSTARYALTAYSYMENSTMVPQPLTDGISKAGVIGRYDTRLYSFTLSTGHAALTISATTSLGDPDIYVTIDGTVPTRTHYNWSSTHFGSDQLTIQSPPIGQYLISIFADTTTVYSLIAITPEGTAELIEGQAIGRDLIRGQYAYFLTQVTDLTRDLTVTVTSLSGDPDLYISDTNIHPGPGNWTWRATSYRNDSITIPASQLHLGIYYISVNAWLNCSFTIIASYNTPIVLQDGRPQHDVILKEQSKYYSIAIDPTSTRDLTISVTPTTGSVRLYVANNQSEPIRTDPSTYQWSTFNAFSSQFLVIFANDSHACPQTSTDGSYCNYWILVYGVTNSEYSVTASSGMMGIDLQEGHPVQLTVDAGVYQYLRFRVTDPARDVAFIVTPVSGDPDIYVITSAADPGGSGASRQHYQWKSELYGGDTLQIRYDDPNFVLGEWEISIYGSTYSSFTAVATTSSRSGNVSSIALVDGLPMGGRISVAGNWNYYTFQPSDPTSAISFSVAKRFGDPDIYISMYPTVPTLGQWNWASTHIGSDYVTVNAADPNACGAVSSGNTPCIFFIGINGYSATSYTLTVTSSMVTGQLVSGSPVYGQALVGTWVYYFIDLSQFNQPILQFSLTANSGDPDIYVSAIYQHPNATASEWSSTNYGSEDFTIVNPPRGIYYVGVYAFNNCSWTLTASYQPVLLSPGQPYTDSITADSYHYYNFHVETGGAAPPNGLTVSLTAGSNGYVDLYLQNNGSLASAGQTNGWSSTATSPSSGRYLIIGSTETQACWTGDSCTYSLAVHSRSWSRFQYTLTVYYGDDIVTLEPAVPFQSFVSKNSTVVFRSMVSRWGHDVSISTTQFIGDVSIYVAQNTTQPSATNYTWAAHSNSTAGAHIAIDAYDPNLQMFQWLWIAVYGESDAQFSVLITTENTLLVSGVPQSDYCSWDHTPKYYFMNFQQPNLASNATLGAITFELDQTYGTTGAYTISILTDIGRPGITQPNATNAMWTQQIVDGQPFSIKPTEDGYPKTSCTFYIAITCPIDTSGWGWGGYQLTGITQDELQRLSVNSESLGVVPAGGQKFYEVSLRTATNFSFVLEPCLGQMDLFISPTYSRPDATHYQDKRQYHDQPDIYYYSANGGVVANGINKIFFGIQEAMPVGIDSSFKVKTAYVDQVQFTSPIVSNPILATTALAPGLVQFQFVPAQSTVKPNPTDPTQLIYSVFWTRADDVNAVLYTQCGAELSKSNTNHDWFNITGVPGDKPWEVTLDNLDDAVYKFNVFVYDPSPLSLSGPTAYTVQQAKPNGAAPSSGSGISKILLGVGIPVAIIVFALLIYLWVKNRRLSKELEVEMHDVPSAALRKAARGAPDVTPVERAQRHHKLLSSDEPDDFSDTYTAPSGRIPQEL